MNRRTRRGLRLAAAVILAACWTTSPALSPAQVVDANRRGGGVSLLPVPGAAGTPVALGQTAIPAWATADHPLFHSSYTGEENRVVANTRYGPVTSRDLYLWLILRDTPRPFLLDAYQRARTVSARNAIARDLKREVDDFVFTNFYLPEQMGSAPCDAVSGLREQLRILPAYQLTYIERLIRPQICIQQADRVKFLQEHQADFAQPERYRVRYIRLRANFDAPIEQQNRVEARISDLRRQIGEGDLTFSDAARQFSEAPSAAQGGEIPPFPLGQLFFFFEDAITKLQPGEVSQPFRGPDGSYYLTQLLEVLPPQEPGLADPAQTAKVDEGLTRKILRAQYEFDGRLLFEERRGVLLTGNWDERRDADLIAYVGEFALTKQQFRDLFPFVEGEDLRRRDELFSKYLRPILEREAMAQVVREAGCDNDPILQRSRWIAANLTRRDAFVEQCEAGLQVNDTIIQSFWRRNPELFTPMTMKRIFRLSLSPTDTGVGPEILMAELGRILDMVIRGEAPTPLPPEVESDPEAIVDQILGAGGIGAQMLFGSPLPPDPLSTDTEAPIQLEELDLDPDETTGTFQFPMSLPENQLPARQEITTETISTVPSLSAVDPVTTDPAAVEAPLARKSRSALPRVMKAAPAGKATTETILLKSNRGGATATPVAGGLLPATVSAVATPATIPGAVSPVPTMAPPVPIIPAAPVIPISPIVPETPALPVATPVPVPGESVDPAALAPPPIPARTILPATSRPIPPSAPAAAPAPVTSTAQPEIDWDALGPYDAIPNPLCPPIYEAPAYGSTLSDFMAPPPPAVPWPSAIPFNPDIRFPKISPTAVKDLFSSYVSPNFVIRVEDMGFLYVRDRREIPDYVANLSPGTFTRPAPAGPAAISYYVANDKRPPRPSFGEIKSKVYATYRILQVKQCIDGTMEEALARARVQYQFIVPAPAGKPAKAMVATRK